MTVGSVRVRMPGVGVAGGADAGGGATGLAAVEQAHTTRSRPRGPKPRRIRIGIRLTKPPRLGKVPTPQRAVPTLYSSNQVCKMGPGAGENGGSGGRREQAENRQIGNRRRVRRCVE